MGNELFWIEYKALFVNVPGEWQCQSNHKKRKQIVWPDVWLQHIGEEYEKQLAIMKSTAKKIVPWHFDPRKCNPTFVLKLFHRYISSYLKCKLAVLRTYLIDICIQYRPPFPSRTTDYLSVCLLQARSADAAAGEAAPDAETQPETWPLLFWNISSTWSCLKYVETNLHILALSANNKSIRIWANLWKQNFANMKKNHIGTVRPLKRSWTTTTTTRLLLSQSELPRQRLLPKQGQVHVRIRWKHRSQQHRLRRCRRTRPQRSDWRGNNLQRKKTLKSLFNSWRRQFCYINSKKSSWSFHVFFCFNCFVV